MPGRSATPESRCYVLWPARIRVRATSVAVARDEAAARSLVCACLDACPDRPFIIDVPVVASWVAWLESMQFALQRPFIRMCRGEQQFRARRDRMFAIADPNSAEHRACLPPLAPNWSWKIGCDAGDEDIACCRGSTATCSSSGLGARWAVR